MYKFKKSIHGGFLALVALALVVCFENCTATKSSSSVGGDSQQQNISNGNLAEVQPSLPATQNNGFGYDGKPYYRLDATVPCVDGSSIKEQINVKSATEAALVKTECEYITPKELPAGSFKVAAQNSDILIYQNQSFEHVETFVLPGLTTVMSCADSAGTVSFVIRSISSLVAGQLNVAGSPPKTTNFLMSFTDPNYYGGNGQDLMSLGLGTPMGTIQLGQMVVQFNILGTGTPKSTLSRSVTCYH